jgi:hypothetical protein
VDSTAHTASGDSEIFNDVLSRVTLGFDTQTTPRDSEINNELLSWVTNGFDNPNGP